MSKRKPPAEIYLQWVGDPDIEVTWCEDEINDDDIPYVLKSRAKADEAERDSTEKSVELHANINRGVATALGLDFGASWHNLPERVSKLVAELAALREQTRRRKYPDEKPEDTFAVLGWNAIGEVFIASYFAGEWWIGTHFQETMNIVEWSLAPTPPESDK